MSFSVSRVKWEAAVSLLKDVREKVFICEWRIPRKIEFDRKDQYAFHVLVCDDITQEPIATGRILSTGEISRIAVLMAFRKRNIDREVMKGLLAIAKDLKLDEIFISHVYEKYEGDTRFPSFEADFPNVTVEEKYETFELRRYTR